MGRKPTGNPVGPPVKEVDWTLFEQLCEVMCTQSEIASMLKVEPETLIKKIQQHYGTNYSETYKRFSESGKCSLRRNQFVHSETNTSMAIWLGKNWLNQVDKSDAEREREFEYEKKRIDYEHDIYNRISRLENALLAKGTETPGKS